MKACGTSMMPAFRNCTSSPPNGCSTRYTRSARWRMSASLWPMPTVSIITQSNRRVSRRQTWKLDGPRPPRSDSDAWLRKNSRRSSGVKRMRVRSPNSAPPDTWLDGSTASTAIDKEVSAASRSMVSRDNSVDLPEPGVPVSPRIVPACAPLAASRCASTVARRSAASGRRSSNSEMHRATACLSRRRAASDQGGRLGVETGHRAAARTGVTARRQPARCEPRSARRSTP